MIICTHKSFILNTIILLTFQFKRESFDQTIMLFINKIEKQKLPIIEHGLSHFQLFTNPLC